VRGHVRAIETIVENDARRSAAGARGVPRSEREAAKKRRRPEGASECSWATLTGARKPIE
jgi:hypothetical protein